MIDADAIVSDRTARVRYETGIWLARHWLEKDTGSRDITVGRATLRILLAGYKRMGELEDELRNDRVYRKKIETRMEKEITEAENHGEEMRARWKKTRKLKDKLESDLGQETEK
jgi:hypothetical protein